MSEPTPQPVAADQLPPPAPGPLHRAGRRVLRGAVDAGLVGARLRAHVVICGFPRSGSILLQLMIETCVAQVHSFSSEVDAVWAAREAPRRRPWLVTKCPSDVDRVPELRRWYATRPGELQLLLTVRDPRAVLTSRHAGYPPSRGYYVSPARWRAVDELVEGLRLDPDATVLGYEDLVTHPDAVQRALTERLGWSVHTPFARFHNAVQPGTLDRMTTGALGGLRPLERAGLTGWRAPEHRGRLCAVLRELPDLPALLVRRGYTTDQSWLEDL